MVNSSNPQVIPAADLPLRPAGGYDFVVGVEGAGRALAIYKATDLPTSAAAQRQINDLKAAQQTSAIYASTISDLQAVAGTYVGQGAFVTNGSGAGQYAWSGAAWVFLRADIMALKADKSELAEKASNRTVAATTAATQAPFLPFSLYETNGDYLPLGAIDPMTGAVFAAFHMGTGDLLASFASDNPSINGIALSALARAVPESSCLYTVDDDIVPLLATRVDGKVYPLVWYSISEGRLYPGAGDDDQHVDSDTTVAFIANGALCAIGGEGEITVDAVSARSWIQVQSDGGVGKGVYLDASGRPHAAMVPLRARDVYPVDVVIGISGQGQSNAPGQAGSARSVVYGEQYEHSDRLRMPATAANNIWMGTPTQGGASTELLPSAITGLSPLRGSIASTGVHGTIAIEGAARRYVRRAAEQAGGWVPDVVAWTNGEGGQGIQNMGAAAGSGYYYFQNLVTTVTRIRDILASQGKRFAFTRMLIDHMESNAGDGAYGDKQYSWFQSVQQAVYAITGQPLPLRALSSQMSSFLGGSQSPRSLLDKAIAIEEEWGDFWCLGPTYLYPYSSDLLHHSSVGHAMRGEYFDAACAVLDRTGSWSPLRMVSARRAGPSAIEVTLSEDAVMDEAWLVASVSNAGITVDVGDVQSVSVSGRLLVITVADAGAVTQVRAAAVGHPSGGPRTVGTIPRSTIRSMASIGTWSAECGGRAMHKPLCHQFVSIGV